MSNSLFQNASHFSTGDVNLNICNNSIKNYINDSASDALELLLMHTTKEATHESVTYSCAPTCHPSTRKIIKNDIMDFIVNAEKPCLKLAWLSGPAGAGKSCIQRTLVEECLAQNIPTFSFFFGKDFGRDNADGFVATIAHQFCNVVPGFRSAILEKISFDPSIFEKSLIRQIHNLVLDPLTDICDLRFWTRRKVIIVDGLDECRDPAQRLQVIQVLRTMTVYFAESFRVIVSSRPEFDILTSFAERSLSSITRKLLLHNYDSDEDIMAYLVEEFARIRRTHPARRRFKKNWPTQQALVTLVKMATGQFIFVSTVIRYIEDRFGFPDLLLEQVLKAVSAGETPPNVPANPFGELDALYTEILQSHAIDRSHLRLILHAVPEIWRIVETNSLLVESGDLDANMGLDFRPSPWMLDSFFGFTPGTTDIVLSQFHALIHTNGNICFYHKSMEDYLKAPERSGDLFQSEVDTAAHFLLASVKNLQRWSRTLRSPIVDDGAAFGALYLCVRFTWKQLPKEYKLSTPTLGSLNIELPDILGFDLTILLGWILLYGRRLWPNPNDMLKHMKLQNAPLGSLKDHWLDPIAEGVKLLHTCERSRLRKWKNKCPSLCKIVRLCCGNSRSVFSFLEENWYLDKREKISKLGDLEEIVLSGSSFRKRVQSWIECQADAQSLAASSSRSSSESSEVGTMTFSFPSKSTRSLSADSWMSKSSSFGSGPASDPQVVTRSSSFVLNDSMGLGTGLPSPLLP